MYKVHCIKKKSNIVSVFHRYLRFEKTWMSEVFYIYILYFDKICKKIYPYQYLAMINIICWFLKCFKILKKVQNYFCNKLLYYLSFLSIKILIKFVFILLLGMLSHHWTWTMMTMMIWPYLMLLVRIFFQLFYFKSIKKTLQYS